MLLAYLMHAIFPSEPREPNPQALLCRQAVQAFLASASLLISVVSTRPAGFMRDGGCSARPLDYAYVGIMDRRVLSSYAYLTGCAAFRSCHEVFHV